MLRAKPSPLSRVPSLVCSRGSELSEAEARRFGDEAGAARRKRCVCVDGAGCGIRTESWTAKFPPSGSCVSSGAVTGRGLARRGSCARTATQPGSFPRVAPCYRPEAVIARTRELCSGGEGGANRDVESLLLPDLGVPKRSRVAAGCAVQSPSRSRLYVPRHDRSVIGRDPTDDFSSGQARSRSVVVPIPAAAVGRISPGRSQSRG